VHVPASQLLAIPTVTPRARGVRARGRRRSGWVRWALLLSIACSGDLADRTAHGETSSGAVAFASVPYREVSLGRFGSIAGVVQLDGDTPADSLIVTTADQEFCGPALVDSSVIRSGESLANVVVWLADVREGKPLPVERRTEIVNAGCRLAPRVHAVVKGTTVNVRNDDRLPHTTRFVRAGTAVELARIPLTDDGQVVPTERLADRAGLVAAYCERHPWTRGYLAVFESPYFAVTDGRGSFRLDSVPPGRYRLVAWHERGVRQVSETIDVRADSGTPVVVRLRLR
jgi:hypothetical protein